MEENQITDDIDSSYPIDWSQAAKQGIQRHKVTSNHPHDNEEIDAGGLEDIRTPPNRGVPDSGEDIESEEGQQWVENYRSIARSTFQPQREFLSEEIEDDSSSSTADDAIVNDAANIEESEEPISDGALAEQVHEAIDTAEMFKQERVVLEFLEDETGSLDLWDFGYSRVLKVLVRDSHIPGFPEGEIRLIVQASLVPHVRQAGDQFVLAEPFHAFPHNGKMYILAPSVSDRR